MKLIRFMNFCYIPLGLFYIFFLTDIRSLRGFFYADRHIILVTLQQKNWINAVGMKPILVMDLSVLLAIAILYTNSSHNPQFFECYL